MCRRRRVLILAHRLRQTRIGEITYTFRFLIQKEIKLASCFFGSFSPSSVVFGGFFGSPLNFFFSHRFFTVFLSCASFVPVMVTSDIPDLTLPSDG